MANYEIRAQERSEIADGKRSIKYDDAIKVAREADKETTALLWQWVYARDETRALEAKWENCSGATLIWRGIKRFFLVKGGRE